MRCESMSRRNALKFCIPALQVTVEDDLVDLISVLTSIFVYRFVFGVNVFACQQIVSFQETSFVVAEKTVVLAGTTPFSADLGEVEQFDVAYEIGN